MMPSIPKLLVCYLLYTIDLTQGHPSSCINNRYCLFCGKVNQFHMADYDPETVNACFNFLNLLTLPQQEEKYINCNIYSIFALIKSSHPDFL
jgi:hypothetical protein